MRAQAEKLMAGETVTFRPRGHSMTGRINDGDLVTVTPVDPSTLVVGDVVLCRVRGGILLHLISAIDSKGRFQISNNKGHVNGYANAIFGKVVAVEA